MTIAGQSCWALESTISVEFQLKYLKKVILLKQKVVRYCYCANVQEGYF